MENKVTIKDIARMAGISVSTVSRILNKTGRYSEETAEKVMKIVEETGYTVNTAARSLRQVETKTIMLMIPDITNDFFSRLAYYIETYLHELGYTTFICNTSSDPEREMHFINEAISKNVDGILAISDLKELPKSFETSPLPLVVLDRRSKDFPFVINDERQGSYDVGRMLYEKGARHMLCLMPVFGKQAFDIARYPRYSGFHDYLKQHSDATQEAHIIISSDRSHEEAEAFVFNLLEKKPEIDAIFCGSDRMAIGALYAAQRHNKRVPDDIQIVGFDNAVYSRVTMPSLTTVGRNAKRLAHTACDVLLETIKDPSKKAASQRIPTRIIKRQSTK